MATAKKLPSGSWRCQVYDYTDENGKRHYKSFTSSDQSTKGKREAERMVADYAVDKEQTKHSSDASMFSDRMESYIVSKEPVLSPATIRGYRNIQKMLLRDYASFCRMEIPVLLGAFCMMRRGEICALTLDDIQGDVIHVHHSLVLGTDKDWHLKAPKTGSSDRYISAPAFVTERIRELRHITTLNPHSITIMFQRALRRANITHFRFHDLRHYSASIRHALGIPDAYIMQEGGWKTDAVLKSVYRHAMSDRQKEMTDRANAHFSELCNTKCNTQK